MPKQQRKSREARFEARKVGHNAVIDILDDIGPSWLGMIDERLIASALGQMGEVNQIDVRLNSLGGSSHEGVGIYNFLKQHPANVRVFIDGIAASAASIIAMAGDEVIMPAGALMMIHEPWTATMGDKQEMLRAANQLDAVIATATEVYQAKSGKDSDTIRQWMSDETWFTGAEAVAAGLADSVGGEVQMSVQLAERQFRNPPQTFQQLIALSAKESDVPKPSKQDISPENPVDPAPSDPSSPPVDPRAEFGEQLKLYTSEFGAVNGSQWLAEGKPIDDCRKLHTAEMEKQRVAELAAKDEQISKLTAERDELKTRIEQAKLGDETPVEFSPPEGSQIDTKLSTGLPPGVARFVTAQRAKAASNN